MSASIGNQLTQPAPAPAVPQAPGPARPALNPLTRFGPAAQPAMAPGPRLPAYALKVPNPLTPQATPPAAVQPSPHPPEQPRSDYGLEHQVSTRLPSGQGITYDPHTRNDLKIDHASMKPDLDDPRTPKAIVQKYHEAADALRQHYPHINTTNMSNDEAHEAFIGHLHDNIVHLWNQVRDRPWLQEAVHWYWGANKYAHDLAQEHGISHRQAAAAIAALSPQTDWNQNVARVERMLNLKRDHAETPFNPEMRQWVNDKIMARKNAKVRQTGLDQLAALPEGAKFKDLSDPVHQAFFMRAHDELYNRDRSYPIISPSGERFQQAPLEGTGAPPKLAWGSFNELRNAFKALQSDDLKNISESLGDKHKVRSFYNNIIAPDSDRGHITADTHAINAGLMMPMGSKHLYVSHGLGAGIPSSNLTGASGLYGLHADAYRRAAQTISRLEGRRYLPREVQSVTWEAIKGLFDKAEHKAQQPDFLDRQKTQRNPDAGMPAHHVGLVAHHFWNLARHGVIRPMEARQAVLNAAGGIADPEWFRLRQAQQAQR